MLTILTTLDSSTIHGLGVMATEPVVAGTLLWRFAPGIDLVLPVREVEAQPAAFRSFIEMYGYPSPEFPDSLVLSCDHAKFLNHSDDPNTEIRGRETFARRAIAAGEEITCNYGLFVEGWTGFD